MDSLECASLDRNMFKTLRTAHGLGAKGTVLGGYGFQEGGSAGTYAARCSESYQGRAADEPPQR
jgi:hypothetical protein